MSEEKMYAATTTGQSVNDVVGRLKRWLDGTDAGYTFIEDLIDLVAYAEGKFLGCPDVSGSLSQLKAWIASSGAGFGDGHQKDLRSVLVAVERLRAAQQPAGSVGAAGTSCFVASNEDEKDEATPSVAAPVSPASALDCGSRGA